MLWGLDSVGKGRLVGVWRCWHSGDLYMSGAVVHNTKIIPDRSFLQTRSMQELRDAQHVQVNMITIVSGSRAWYLCSIL